MHRVGKILNHFLAIKPYFFTFHLSPLFPAPRLKTQSQSSLTNHSPHASCNSLNLSSNLINLS